MQRPRKFFMFLSELLIYVTSLHLMFLYTIPKIFLKYTCCWLTSEEYYSNRGTILNFQNFKHIYFTFYKTIDSNRVSELSCLFFWLHYGLVFVYILRLCFYVVSYTLLDGTYVVELFSRMKIVLNEAPHYNF